MACTRSKRSSDEAPSPPMCSAFTTIEKAQCKISTDSRGLSPELGGVQALRMQVADSTTKAPTKDLLSSLSSIRFTESGSEALEARMTHPRRVNSAQQLAQFPWGSYLVSPERQEESSTNVTELLSPAELSQPKSAYFVGYSIHRVDRKSFQTQIPEARLSEPTFLTVENVQTPMPGSSTDSAAADVASPHQELEKGFSAAPTTTLKDLPPNPVPKKTRAPSEGTHTQCDASPESYCDRSTIDFVKSPSRTTVKVKRTHSNMPSRSSFETRSTSSPTRAARSDTLSTEGLVESPKLIPPSFKGGDLQESTQLSDERRAALAVATSLFTLNESRQLTLGDDTPTPPRAPLPWLQPPALRHQTNIEEDADMMQIHGIGNIQPLQEIDVQGRTSIKVRFNPCSDSPELNPPMLQPRISSGYALKEEVDEMLHMARPLSVNYYRFGSPRPINYCLNPTPIKVPEVGCHTSTPRQLEPSGILSKPFAHCADCRLPPVSPSQYDHPPNTTQRDLLVDSPLDATEDQFFLQTPQAMRDHTYSSPVAKRLKTSDFDDIVHIADDDFMCLDLLDAFSA
ncbi:hypothetical protein MHU86_861 [Fragilaria crotonensis]|nr:hypothetical protein MHU86_861 [Fragilaria crotonensis]